MVEKLLGQLLQMTARYPMYADFLTRYIQPDFEPQVIKIVNNIRPDRQTVLFSATLPKWVADISSRFLTPGYTTIDLVGNEKQKASSSVQHRLINCQWSERTDLVCDLIRATVPGDGRVIVFCDTKRDCGELQEALQKELEKGAKALHGDVNQSQREVVLDGFRKNKFQTLVATDVAARGLDVRSVKQVVNYDMPMNVSLLL